MTPVLIKWVDIVTWSGWNDELIETNQDQPAEFETVGFLVRYDKHRVTITDTDNTAGNITTFPIGCIKSIKKLKEDKREPIKLDTDQKN